MALSTQPYKGARDFYPEDKRLQKYMFKKLRQVAERFGYEEYDAPVIEPTELYLAKSNKDMISEETYTFVDRGDRSVTIRPEMTPTVSRMVAGKRQELAYPVRWYSIPNLWRYERPQRGRLREHWQLNVDIFGVDGIAADHEIIQIADQALRSFGAKREMYTIKLNSRKLINAVMTDVLGLDATQSEMLIRLIDRITKMEHSEFVAIAESIFTPTQRDNGAMERLMSVLTAKTVAELPVSPEISRACEELKALMAMLASSGISNAVFDVTLMRGFDYYTDIVFEVFDNAPENNRAMFGGGRYDGLVGLFGVEPVPTVGFGMGDVTLQIFLEAHKLLPKLAPETEVYAVLIGDVYEQSIKSVEALRNMGVKVAVDSTGRKPDKQLKTAVRKGVKYAIFVGEKEIADGTYTIKNLATGKEEKHSLERLVSLIKRHDDDRELEDDV